MIGAGQWEVSVRQMLECNVVAFSTFSPFGVVDSKNGMTNLKQIIANCHCCIVITIASCALKDNFIVFLNSFGSLVSGLIE